MPDEKISALTDGTTPADADDFVIARTGSSLRLTWAAIKAAIGGVTPPVTLTGTNPATIPLTIAGAAAQATDYLDIQDSNGNAVLTIERDGATTLNTRSATTNHVFNIKTNNGVRAIDVQGDGAGATDTITLACATLDMEADSVVFLGSTAACSVRAVGILNAQQGVVLQNHAAPADGDLGAGDCALWFDQTNGAAKLMVKAKTADGTVVTGSVNLT